MIYREKFKNVPAVIVESSALRAALLPEYGCKLASLVDTATGTELLAQNPGTEYLPLGMKSEYVKAECSAFDDMFPNIDPQGIRYPCHGEICRRRHTYSIKGETLKMRCISVLLPYVFEKTISESGGGAIRIEYRVENLGVVPLACLWAGHIMLAATEGGIIGTSFSDGASVEYTFDENDEFGAPGVQAKLKSAMLTSCKFDAFSGNAYKFYFTEKMPTGTLTYTRPDINKTVAVTVDNEKLPYLGVWINNGRFKGMYNAALEPCTAPFDNPEKAASRGYKCELDPGAVLEFTLMLDVK